MTPETIGDVIVALRTARGWSQTELAKRAGVGRNNIAMIETNMASRNPTLATLRAIFNALDVDIEIEIVRRKSK